MPKNPNINKTKLIKWLKQILSEGITTYFHKNLPEHLKNLPEHLKNESYQQSAANRDLIIATGNKSEGNVREYTIIESKLKFHQRG
jgi:hypothetical protein